MRRLILFLLSIIWAMVVSAQTVIFVSQDGNSYNTGLTWGEAKSTLSDALSAVSGPTHIYMKVGSYTCQNLTIPDGVTVTGGYASSSTGTDTTQRLYPGTNANWDYPTLCTILSGENSNRVATVNTGGKLEGCVITKGKVMGNGGGVLINGGTVQHCIIIRNYAIDEDNLTAKGGGAYVQSNGSLFNCVVAYNFANNGPAVAGTDGILTNNTITANYSVSNCGTVNDIDGNTYTTIVIGEQCWMRENLRTTRYADGTSIILGGASFTDVPRRYNPNNNTGILPTYGYTYNWYAVMNGVASSNANPSGVRGVCPTGWHVPSDSEWTQLTDYLQNHTAFHCNDNITSIAKSLASATGWNSSGTICDIGNTQELNNASFFNAMPAGIAKTSQSVGTWYVDYNDFGSKTCFWTATEDSDYGGKKREFIHNSAVVNSGSQSKHDGFSVRCLRDQE
ncbi:MAG: fibrobacter succinogenes major paralogous domain-containing protein [Bacteroidales bacterium]|nr:fibrobacter succinogenes major paralogous domain-containing protein [Bacteroidales bacterium]